MNGEMNIKIKCIMSVIVVMMVLTTSAGAVLEVSRNIVGVINECNRTLQVVLTPSKIMENLSYQVTETIPAGFTLISSTADNVSHSGQFTNFTMFNTTPIIYSIIMSLNGTFSFTGQFRYSNGDIGMVTGMTSPVIRIPPYPRSSVCVSVFRNHSPVVLPTRNLNVTLTPSPYQFFDMPGYQVIETIPQNFTLLNASTYYTFFGNVYTFTSIGSSPIRYSLNAPSVVGNYLINGTFKDESKIWRMVMATNIKVGYDTDNNGIINRSEAVQAVLDYFAGIITKQEAIEIVIRYFE